MDEEFEHVSCPPQQFVVDVFSELPEETVRQRWEAVNVVLRLSMLSGLPMQLEPMLDLLLDSAHEIVKFESALVYLWDEAGQLQASVGRELDGLPDSALKMGNVFNFWATRHGRPLLVKAGQNLQADSFLGLAKAASALIVPLMTSNRIAGTLQMFSGEPGAFSPMDAQLLWILCLVCENQLSRETSHEGLIRFAFTDFLTGLKTRGYFEQQLELELKRAARKNQCFALLMIDIDWFKKLNDRYGHHVGDRALRDVAAVLMQDMREVDTAARYGGEEFVMILPETNDQEAWFVAQRLRRGVESAKFVAGPEEQIQHLTISVGVAIFPTDAKFKQDLIESADAALYEAKSAGRNCVKLYAELAGRRREVS